MVSYVTDLTWNDLHTNPVQGSVKDGSLGAGVKLKEQRSGIERANECGMNVEALKQNSSSDTVVNFDGSLRIQSII